MFVSRGEFGKCRHASLEQGCSLIDQALGSHGLGQRRIPVEGLVCAGQFESMGFDFRKHALVGVKLDEHQSFQHPIADVVLQVLLDGGDGLVDFTPSPAIERQLME